jgi:hypothetical protein
VTLPSAESDTQFPSKGASQRGRAQKDGRQRRELQQWWRDRPGLLGRVSGLRVLVVLYGW